MNKTDRKRESNRLFSISEQQLFDLLGSSSQGLGKNEISDRKNKYGKNDIRDQVRIKGVMLFLKQFKSPLILILAAAAILSIFLDQRLDSMIILEEGRRTFANTLKYILTTSSANFGNMISMAMASAFLGFLPLLPKQILINNFLSDLPLLAITTDRVDKETMQRPQKWNVRFIRNFVIMFGLISTLFDLLTFAILIFVFQTDPDLFRTGWFLVSLLTEIEIIFVIRTRKSVFTGRPSRWLVYTSVATITVTIVLIYLPIYDVTGFVPLGGILFFSLVLISLAYLLATEWYKKRFYKFLEG